MGECPPVVFSLILDIWFSNALSPKKNAFIFSEIVMVIDCKTVRIFAYSSTLEQSNKRSGTKLKTESETGERRFFSVASHALRACEARALRTRKTLTPRFTDFFTDFEKKPTVLQSIMVMTYE